MQVSRAAVLFVFMTVVIDSMGIGIIMPVMPDLIRDIDGGDLGQAAIWGGILSTIYAVFQFGFGPIVGNLSDHFGRRPVMLTALGVMAIDYVIMGLAGAMWILVIGRIIGGITGATHSTANAFMADMSTDENRARNFGLVGAGFGLGFILGPLLGGLLSEFGPRAPFFGAAALAFANMVLGYLVLPETVTDEIRRPFTWARANPFGAVVQIRKLPGLTRLLIVFFLYNVAFFVYPAIWAYFTQERFDWVARDVGISLAIFGLAMALVQGGLVGPVVKRLGEHRAVLTGLTLNFAAFVAFCVVPKGWMVYALAPISALGGLTSPALQGIMSRSVSKDAQGELQGILTSVAALGMIVAPLIMTQTFGLFTGDGAIAYFPAAPFVVSAALMVVVFVVFSGRTRLHGADLREGKSADSGPP